MVTKTNNRMIDGAPVSLEDYGADPTGTNDATEQVRTAFAAGRYVEQRSGVFKLSGTGDIIVSASCNLSGCQFDVDGWTGQFRLDRNETVTEYGETSAIVQAIEASTRLIAGTSDFDGLATAGIRDLEGCVIFMEVDQPFYTYRNTVVSRYEMNYVSNLGILASPVKYALTGLNITKVTATKVNASKFKVQGLSFIETDISQTPNGVLVLAIDQTRVEIDATFLSDKNDHTFNNTRLRFERCPFLRINGLFTDVPIKTPSNDFGYSFSLFDCYDVIIRNVHSDGYGWGVDGGGGNQKVTYENCSLSRIDSHEPFREYLKLVDCNIGSWGLTIVGLGDVYLTRCKALRKDTRTFESFITGRLDCGSIVDGNCYIEDLVIEGRDGQDIPTTFRNDAADTNSLPAGSPIRDVFFNTIIVDGIHTDKAANGFLLYECNDNGQSRRPFAPDKITVNNYSASMGAETASLAIKVLNFDFNRLQSRTGTQSDSRTAEFGTRVILNDCNVDWLLFQDTPTSNICLYVSVTGLTGSHRYLQPNVELGAYGRYELTACDIGTLRTSSTSAKTVMVNGGRIQPKGTFAENSWNTLLNNRGNLSYIECRHVDLIALDNLQLANAQNSPTAFINKDCNIVQNYP